MTTTRPLICFGNSLTEGYRVPPEASYPTRLGRLTGLSVENFGISGNTTGDGVSRLGAVLRRNPFLTLVEFGLNDWYYGIPLPEAAANLSAMASALKDADSKVVLIGFSLPDPGVAAWTSMYGDLAAQQGAGLIDDVFSGLSREHFLDDLVHPNAAGYGIIAGRCHRYLLENGWLEPS